MWKSTEEYVTILSAIVYDNNEEHNAEETKTSCSKKAHIITKDSKDNLYHKRTLKWADYCHC